MGVQEPVIEPADQEGWLLRRLSPGAGQGVRRRALICVPFAGGTATAFWPMVRYLPESVALYAVQLPGRQGSQAPPFRSWRPTVAALADCIERDITEEFALFGHSMGAMLAFEITRELRRRGAALPGLLTVSGAVAPDRRGSVSDAPIDLNDLDCLQALGGMASAWLRRRSFREPYLATLRADLALFKAYEYRPQPPLDVPVLALGGVGDQRVPPFALEAWESHSARPSQTMLLPGGHFFLWDSLPVIISAMLAAWGTSAGGPDGLPIQDQPLDQHGGLGQGG